MGNTERNNKEVQNVNSRITKQQKTKLVEFMANHVDFARGVFYSLGGGAESQRMWTELTNLLNSMGGCKKSDDQWKKCWQDMKSSVRKLRAAQQKFANKTGGGSNLDENAPRPLSNIEEEILKIITLHSTDGDGSTPEGGPVDVQAPTSTSSSFAKVQNTFSPPKKRARRENSLKGLFNSAMKKAESMQTATMSKLDIVIDNHSAVTESNKSLTNALKSLVDTQSKLTNNLSDLINIIKAKN